jgi:GNAT superfamily N-acetyltransferase
MTMTSRGQHIQLFDEGSPRAGELLRELHDEVLSPSFRPEEYVPPTGIDLQGILALIGCADDGAVIGGALGEVYPASGALLLGYLAVRPGCRGTGVGSLLLTALKQRWIGRHPLAFLELDDPRHHGAHPVYGDPVRRLSFYAAFGIRLLAVPYFQPRLRTDLPRGDHMFLGVIPPDGATPPASVPARQVTAFLREYFAACEGPAALDDPEVQWLLRAAGEVGEIPAVNPAAYATVPDTTPPPAR